MSIELKPAGIALRSPSESGSLVVSRGWKVKLVDVVKGNVSYDMASTVITSFCLFGLFTVQGIVLARLLGPAGRGQYATGVFFVQTLTFIGMLGTQQAMARWAARRINHAGPLLHLCSRLGAFTGLITMLVVALLAMLTLPAEKQQLIPLCLLCSLFLPLEHMRQLRLSVEHGLGKFKSYNRKRIVAGLAFPVLLMLLWSQGVQSVLAVGVCFVLAPLIGLLYDYFTTPAGSSSERGPSVKKMLKRGRSYSLALMASDLFDRIDIYLFLWLTSFTAQGLYAAAVPAANLLLVFPNAIALFAFNAGANHQRLLTSSRLLKVSVIIVGVQLVTVVVFAWLLEPLMLTIFGEPFRAAVPFGLALLPAYALAGCAQVAEAYLQGRNRAIVGVWSRVVGAVTLLLFVWVFYDRWEALSIPLGAIAGHLVGMVLLYGAILKDVLLRNNHDADVLSTSDEGGHA